MEEKVLKLGDKISLFTLAIILFILVITSSFYGFWTIRNVKDNIKVNNMNLAVSISEMSDIGDLIEKGEDNELIRRRSENIRKSTKDIDLLVIADMRGIRLSHPNKDRIGKELVGGDEKAILNGSQPYISEAKGTLGNSLRAFAPIYNSQGEQTGFVVVGTLVDEIVARQKEASKYIVLYSSMGLIFSLICAMILSKNIKKTLLGLEPEEISMMYIERENILDALNEGLIALDEKNIVTLINKAGLEILDIREPEPVGKNILDIIEDDNIEEILKDDLIVQREETINNRNMIINLIPIQHEKKKIGTVATFRDRSEVTKLAEDITGYNQIVKALRANNHEFKNKLHVILGLIHIGELDMAKEYILKIEEDQEYIGSQVLNNIKNPTVVGLIYGKISRGSELGVKFRIDKDSHLNKPTGDGCDKSLIIIIGNLIENAFDAVVESSKEEKIVNLSIEDMDDFIRIRVKDNGIGMDKKTLDKIFERGFTTKDSGGGIGLSLVREKLKFFGGDIRVKSEIGIGTEIEADLPKE